LPVAIKHLDDQELDRLAAAAFAELVRRGRKPPIQDKTSFKQRFEDAAASLTPGRLNAVRAAFRAGVTPSRIARQFGIPQADVRKALAGILSKSAKL
jgi:DNA-directed RNA polymerase specialized sigma24 family protein